MTSLPAWNDVYPVMETRCHDSLVSQRVPFLQSLQTLIKSETLEAPQLGFISSILLNTFTIYCDHKSKRLVQDIFRDILTLEPRLLEKYVQFILTQTNKNAGAKAHVDYLNLLEWVNNFIEFTSQDKERFQTYIPKLLEAHCHVGACIEVSLSTQEPEKKSIKKRNQHFARLHKTLLKTTKKALVHCLKPAETSVELAELMFKIVLVDHTKLKLPVTGVVVIMGSLTQAILQLAQSHPQLYNLLKDNYCEKYCKFIGKEVILSKIPPSAFCQETFLSPFIKEFLTEETLKTDILPNIEMANLRSPETGFTTTSELYSAIDVQKIDILHVFISSKLITQSFSSLKSSKEVVRKITLESLHNLLSTISKDKTQDEDLVKFVDEVFKNIKSNLNADYKALASKIICQIPKFSADASKKVALNLSNYILKESNETALTFMLDAFYTHYFSLQESVPEINTTIENGFKEKKPALRKLWFIGFLKNCNNVCIELLETFQSQFLEFVTETLNNEHKHDHESLLACMEYLNKEYSRIPEKLNETVNCVEDKSFYGDVFVNASISTSLSSEERLRASVLLSELFKKTPSSVGLSVAKSLEKKIQNVETQQEEKLSFRYIIPIFNALSQPIEDKEALINVLVELVIVSQYPFKLKNGWAGLVLNAHLDPSLLVSKNAAKFVRNISEITKSINSANTDFYTCALNAAAYLSFINPDVISPLIIEDLKNDLNTEALSRYTDEDYNVWKGEEGIMVIDVLEKEADKKVSNKNTKDYETLKWEQELRKKQGKKNIRKYTKEEQELVNQQLEKESQVRCNIWATVSHISRGIQLIDKLSEDAKLVDNGIHNWYPIAVSALVDLAKVPNTAKFIGEKAVTTFLTLSQNVSDRLGSFRLFVGLSNLRVNKVSNIPENFMQEPLDELLSRVLFRIKFVSNQQPLEAISLTYLLPLLTNVLEEGKNVALKNANKPVVKTEFVEEDKEEEHLLLAMEIISVHSSVFEDPSIPRVSIISVLLSLLTLASKAKIAKECFNALCQSISVAPTDDDLKIILSKLLSPNPFVRSTILETLDNEFELEPFMKWSTEVFICRFESDEGNRELAEFIWEFSKFVINEDMMNSLLDHFDQDDSGLRLFTARAYAAGTFALEKETPGSLHTYTKKLLDFYQEKAKPLKDVIDSFGLVVVTAAERKDPWEERSTAAIALKELAAGFKEDSDDVVGVIRFLIEDGALGDIQPLVRQEIKEAGIEIIAKYGAKNSEKLIPIFEDSLMSDTTTTIKENVSILYGTLARHLQTNDSRITNIVERLLATLDTPSPDVQQAIAECISPLVFQFKDKVQDYITNLMQKLLDPNAPTAIRKGAAWGIAGLVQGYGISALSDFDIIRNTIEASEDKKEAKRRESVAYLYEYLSILLKKFFEPYVIEVLPNILKNLGDAVPEVRNATAEATKSIMTNTTSYGVSKLIPVAISNLDEISWRTKRGSVELLGNMAYLDPAQLSASLSTIVPQIVGVLNDSHKEVRKAADESLNRFGEVIRNPEIQQLVPVLIKAIGDPTKYTEEALDALIKTQFVHYIDGPSLALIIHVIHRGMHDRSANTKRKACKIVGNMAILVDTKDLIPYLQQLIDEVEVAMVDPVPNTRATAARALGALVERLGEEQFPDLIPRLLDTLSDEEKSGDRLGSAQALAEVISGLGISKLEELLPTILDGVTNSRTYVREGYMPLLLFIPICFGAQFAPYINQIIQPILVGLADVDEDIQQNALKAGKLIVKNYATKAIDLLLPELERGMFDENDRIRLSSVQLTGELLFQVTGISSRNEFDEEEGEYHGEISNKIVDILGQERRDRVLAALFVCRNDTSGIVRASTVDIWKALVPNTPRTVKEVLPTLTVMIVTNLASTSSVLRNIAAQTLGDMVRRVGGNALSQLLPTLEASLQDSTNPDSRQGVCIALHELIESANQDALDEFQPIIVNIIRQTLTDSNESVRQAAASSFDIFQSVTGKVAVDEIIPYLLHMLESSDNSGYALLGLQEIMSTKSEVIFPILIPTLLAPPIDSFRASALGSLAEVAGTALYKRLSTIINALVDGLVNTKSPEEAESLEVALEKVFLSVTEDEGLHPLLQQIMSLVKNEDVEKRVVILERLPNFFQNTVLDIDMYIPDFVSHAILSLDDDDSRIMKATFDALSVLVKKLDKPMLEKLVIPAKQSIQIVGTQGQDLAAFCLPKGPNCVLPIFLHGLMYGSSDEREASALAIADVVSKTPAANLKPYVSVITGPLIRVVGERFSSDIKAAILYALNILFVKIPQFLRPFIPQLQRTFVKSLSDISNETLRLRAAKALGTLIEYQPRVDPLVIELANGAKQAEDEGVKTAMLKALLEVVTKAGSKLNETSKNNIINLVEEQIMASSDKLAIAYAKLIGSLSEILSTDEARKILEEKVLSVSLEGNSGKFAILTLNSFLRDSPNHIFQEDLISKFTDYICNAINSADIELSEHGVIASGKLLLLTGETKSPYSKVASNSNFELDDEQIKKIVDTLSVSMLKPVCNSNDVRRLSLVVIRTAARFKVDECITPNLDTLGLSVFSCLRDPIIPIKLAAEKAYLAIFQLIEDVEMNKFTEWFEKISDGKTSLDNIVGTTVQVRSVGDFTKRVGKRLANVERERIAAGGDAEAMYSDRFEDENEIWAVGGVEMKSDI